jgi:hypothetical protein
VEEGVYTGRGTGREIDVSWVGGEAISPYIERSWS